MFQKKKFNTSGSAYLVVYKKICPQIKQHEEKSKIPLNISSSTKTLSREM